MSARSTAEIVADLRASATYQESQRQLLTADQLRQAADRLTELHAKDRERLWLKGELQVTNNLRPPCPTCSCGAVVGMPHDSPAATWLYDPCPDCVDGKVSIERLVAVFNAVWDDNNIELDGTYQGMDADHLRAIR